MRGMIRCFRSNSYSWDCRLKQSYGSHLTMSLALEAGDRLMTECYSSMYTILSSMRKGQENEYLDWMMAPQYSAMYSPFLMGRVANRPIPPPGILDALIQILIISESVKIGGVGSCFQVRSNIELLLRYIWAVLRMSPSPQCNQIYHILLR